MKNKKKNNNKKKRPQFIRKDGFYYNNGRHGSLYSGDINWNYFEY